MSSSPDAHASALAFLDGPLMDVDGVDHHNHEENPSHVDRDIINDPDVLRALAWHSIGEAASRTHSGSRNRARHRTRMTNTRVLRPMNWTDTRPMSRELQLARFHITSRVTVQDSFAPLPVDPIFTPRELYNTTMMLSPPGRRTHPPPRDVVRLTYYMRASMHIEVWVKLRPSRHRLECWMIEYTPGVRGARETMYFRQDWVSGRCSDPPGLMTRRGRGSATPSLVDLDWMFE